MKIYLLFALSLSILSLHSMEKRKREESLERLPETPAKKIKIEKTIPVVIMKSETGAQFELPQDIALQAGNIKDFFTDFPTAPYYEILSSLDPALDLLQKIFWSAHFHDNLKNKALLDEIEKEVIIPINYALALLILGDNLDSTLLQDLGARRLAKKIIESPSFFTQLKKLLADNYNEATKDFFLGRIAHFLYLIDPKNSFGQELQSHFNLSFSFQDYLDYYFDFNRDTKLSKNGNRTLVIDYDPIKYDPIRLNTLQGLENLPDKEVYESLYLYNNSLDKIPSHILKDLSI